MIVFFNASGKAEKSSSILSLIKLYFEGIVSANKRKVNGLDYIMFSAPVTNGNSGGPLFDEFGLPIGIVTFGREDAVGMNYAIGSQTINAFLNKASREG